MKTLKENCRYLISEYPHPYRIVEEVVVMEISKNHVKLKHINSDGNTSLIWHKISDIKIIEELKPLEIPIIQQTY